MTATATVVSDNRDATGDDAITLGVIYRRLDKAVKSHRKAVKALGEVWGQRNASIEDARTDRDTAQYRLDEVMDESWAALNALPNGTVASGGATPQTVALQFYSANLNRNLGKRLTAKEARAKNAVSFS